jgi:hypothetical protein
MILARSHVGLHFLGVLGEKAIGLGHRDDFLGSACIGYANWIPTTFCGARNHKSRFGKQWILESSLSLSS